MVEAKYRIKLLNGRIIGPLNVEEIDRLYKQGHLNGGEQVQVWPAGDWKDFDEFKDIFFRVVQNLIDEKTTPPLNQGKTNSTNLNSAKKEKIEVVENNLDAKVKEFDFLNDSIGGSDPLPPKNMSLSQMFEKETKVTKTHSEIERTKIARPAKNILADKQFQTKINKDLRDRTIIESPKTQLTHRPVKHEAEKKDEESPALQDKLGLGQDALILNPENVTAPDGGAGEHTVIASFSPELAANTAIKRLELNLQEEQSLLEIAKNEIKESQKPLKNESKKEPDNKKIKNQKKSTFQLMLTGAVLVFIFLYLFDDDTKHAKFEPKIPQILFPQIREVEDKELARQKFMEGLSKMNEHGYLSMLEASRKMSESISYSFENNPAIGHLIELNTDLLYHDPNFKKSSLEIFKLIEIAKINILSDQHVAIGTAKFFLAQEKPRAAFKIIEDYLRVYRSSTEEKRERLSVDFFSVYLEALISLGEFDKAKDAFEKLMTVDKKSRSPHFYRSVYLFHEKNDNYQEALNIINEGIEAYPRLISLRLSRCEIFLKFENFKTLQEELSLIKELNYEYSVIYYAHYLELQGYLFALQKKNKDAAVLFTASLKIKENPKLRSLLASIKQAPNESADITDLVLESKVIDLINQAKVEIKNENWNKALFLAIEAKEMMPQYTPAILFCAKVQIERGYFKEAIDSLEASLRDNSFLSNVILTLVEAYTESFKLDEAFSTLARLNDTETRKDWKYASHLAQIYLKRNQFIEAVKWLKESVRLNPLNDEDYFELGKLYLKYKKFDEARVFIQKAIALDPSNSEYQVTFSNILYEMDNVDVAIGYLREVLEIFPNDPEILGQITIYYYRSGQIKQFEEYRQKTESTIKAGRKLYSFLVKANRLEDKLDETIEAYNKLIESDPGDLKTLMEFGEFLISQGKTNEALNIFERVKEKLPSYPRLKYYLANIKLIQGRDDEALILAEEEVKLNPSIEYGHNLLGQIYTKKEDFSKALEHFKLAQRINQSSVDAILGLAWIKYQQNQIDAALDLYLKAAQLDPNNSFVHKQLGNVYKSIGQHQLAIESFKVYLDLNPEANDKAQIESLIKNMR